LLMDHGSWNVDHLRVSDDSMNSPIAIIGAGGWGTALAITMARHGKEVRLWAYEPYLVETMLATRENPL
jgi:glycerol-3-phosphate dehydrogenase